MHTFRATCEGDRDEVYRLARLHGFLEPGSELTVDDVYGWWSMMSAAALADQPHTFTADDSTEAMRSFLGETAASAAFRQMTIPSDYVMLARINLGVNAVLTELGATFDTREQADVLDGVSEPRSELTRAHAAWARGRGLPFGLDPR